MGGVVVSIAAAVAVFSCHVQLLPVFDITTSLVTLLDGEHGPDWQAELLPGLKSNRMFSESRTAFRILPVSVTTPDVD
ncbi:hypothetical protein H9L15_14075 [Sphingomonas daechungensis]|uniref:Secreted protein n=1 Tax=Sphingomonas daechungensis TaxID=1176646 RepID=A0ABX6T056_9SPHN|nr:hypothetical protein H9L15_14075 [Sphingomonas daechungensis]